jgi:hypothetical protein
MRSNNSLWQMEQNTPTTIDHTARLTISAKTASGWQLKRFA